MKKIFLIISLLSSTLFAQTTPKLSNVLSAGNDAGSKKITGLANGVSAQDAATVGQLSGGTVTTVTITPSASGVSGTVATPTTTPTFSITLGQTVKLGSYSITATGTSTITGNNTGDQTDITGNAATVTTNANLTGVITSVGNATSIASQTGTGTTIVTSVSPTMTGTVTVNGTVNILSTPAINAGSSNFKPLTWNSSSGNVEILNTTGTGSVVMSSSPTLVTPALGTPSALVGTNISGTAASLTAGNVTTNANLTGEVTSVGNAAVLGSFTSSSLSTALTNETGSGSSVFATSPTFTTTNTTPVIIGCAAGSNDNLSFTDADNTNPFSSLYSTTGLFGNVVNSGSVTGGMDIQGFSSSAITPGLVLQGYIGSTSPTTSAVSFRGSKLSGSTGANLAYNEAAFTFDNNSGVTHYMTIAPSVITFSPTATSSGTTGSFIFSSSNNTSQTAVTEVNGVLWNSPSRSWSGVGGSFPTQREWVITAPTYNFPSGATTITSPTTFHVTAPIAGTNATFTTPLAALFTGNVSVAGGLDVTSTTASFVPPRMTTTQRDALSSPLDGSIIFNTTTGVHNYYASSAWSVVGTNVFISNGTFGASRIGTITDALYFQALNDSGNKEFTLRNSGGTGRIFNYLVGANDADISMTGSGGGVQIDTRSAVPTYFNCSAYHGIGTASPTHKLEVVATTTGDGLYTKIGTARFHIQTVNSGAGEMDIDMANGSGQVLQLDTRSGVNSWWNGADFTFGGTADYSEKLGVNGNIYLNGIIKSATTQTTVSNSTSGTTVFSEPFGGSSYKKVMVYCNAALGTASYTFPVAFTNTPMIMSSNSVGAAVITALSTTAMTVTGATTTGFITIEGF